MTKNKRKKQAPKPDVRQTPGQFATAARNRLKEVKWSVMKLAKTIDMTYEHTRKCCLGVAFFSYDKLERVCAALGLDVEEMNKLASADKIERKYGNLMYELSGKTPRFTKFERLLPFLTEEQYEIILGQAEGWDRRNREVSSHKNSA